MSTTAVIESIKSALVGRPFVNLEQIEISADRIPVCDVLTSLDEAILHSVADAYRIEYCGLELVLDRVSNRAVAVFDKRGGVLYGF